MRRCAIRLAAALAAVTACHVDEPVGDVRGVLFGVAAATSMTNEATQESAFTSVELKTGRTFDLDRIYRALEEMGRVNVTVRFVATGYEEDEDEDEG